MTVYMILRWIDWYDQCLWGFVWITFVARSTDNARAFITFLEAAWWHYPSNRSNTALLFHAHPSNSVRPWSYQELLGAHYHSIEVHRRAGIMNLNPKTKPNERLSPVKCGTGRTWWVVCMDNVVLTDPINTEPFLVR